MAKLKNKEAEVVLEPIINNDEDDTEGVIEPSPEEPIIVEPPKDTKQPMARRYYGQHITQIKFLIPRVKNVYEAGMVAPRPMPGHYTVTLRQNASDSPQMFQKMDPTGKGVIYDPDDGRLNIKGNPFLYVIDLEHLLCEGGTSESEFDDVEFDSQMLKSYFIHIAAKPIKDPGKKYKYKPIQKIVDSIGTRKLFWCTNMPAVVFEEVPLGSAISYDPQKYKAPPLKHGKYLDTTKLAQEG